jgi:hypothetical protein
MRNTENVRRSAAPNLLVQFSLVELTLQLAVDPSKNRRSIPARADGKSRRSIPAKVDGKSRRLIPTSNEAAAVPSPSSSGAAPCNALVAVLHVGDLPRQTLHSTRCRTAVVASSDKRQPRKPFPRASFFSPVRTPLGFPLPASEPLLACFFFCCT